jgi:acyl-coenzyme A synthetase/AMP-(fatty) acid ligase
MHTHASALSFVDWCSDTFAPTSADRFSSHAPFHFDLSILDLYVPLKYGAALVLIGEEAGKQPQRLAALIAERRLTVWYSTPSILRLLLEFGRMERYDYSALRLVLFAGEVFPVKHLRALQALWPHPRYFNLYGPTETNVCTYYKVPGRIPEDRTEPLPIGRTCENDRDRVVDAEERELPPGSEGELYVAGGSVMQGYWHLPERNDRAFFRDGEGTRWYRTGDLVREAGDGNYLFLGRKDRMVKRRGYRVELGEIEAALYRHPAVREAAVVALSDEESGVLIKAYLDTPAEGEPPSLIELKRFCAENLPLYMIPDRFSFQASLPKTSTDKIDYQTLKELV